MWKLVHLLLDFINTPLEKKKKESHKSLPYSGLRLHNSAEQPQRIHFLPLPSQKNQLAFDRRAHGQTEMQDLDIVQSK